VVIHYEEALYQVYAPLPFTFILLGDRGTCVLTTCPGVALDSGVAGIRTRDLLIAIICHRATNLKKLKMES